MDRRVFASSVAEGPGDVDAATRFHYREQDGVVWADYSGGAVRRGHLIGTRRGDRLDFRYVHLGLNGETSSGRCCSVIEVLDHGRVRLHEQWAWESRPGQGHSVLDEIAAAD